MALDVKLRSVIGDDASRLLAAMLQGMQAERDDGRCILTPEDAEHAAFVVEVVVRFGGKHVARRNVRCVCHGS